MGKVGLGMRHGHEEGLTRQLHQATALLPERTFKVAVQGPVMDLTSVL